MKNLSVEDQVARILARAATPGLRVPRSVSEMHLALMDSRGSGMTSEEMKLRNQASVLGGVRLQGELEDVLLAGGDVEELQAVIDRAAAAIASESGSEVGRLMGDRARRAG